MGPKPHLSPLPANARLSSPAGPLASGSPMSLDSIPHLSLGTAVLIIFVICVALVLLRGMAKILTGTVILAVSGWVGLTVWHMAPELSQQLFGKSVGLLLVGLPVLAFISIFWIQVKALGFILMPLEILRSDDEPKTSLVTGLIVAVIPTVILFLLTASLFHHFGAIEEIRAFAAAPNSEKPNQIRKFLRNYKTSLDAILPDKVLRTLDPATDPARVKAAKLVTKRSHEKYPPTIDPSTGQPYPRAIIVDDPELQNLAREGKFGTLLRHPILSKVTEDPDVRKLVERLTSQ